MAYKTSQVMLRDEWRVIQFVVRGPKSEGRAHCGADRI
jgi:hypothetical protein